MSISATILEFHIEYKESYGLLNPKYFRRPNTNSINIMKEAGEPGYADSINDLPRGYSVNILNDILQLMTGPNKKEFEPLYLLSRQAGLQN